MGVGLGVGDVGAAGDELADPGAQLLVEVELAVLVSGEVLPVEGLPALGGLLRAEFPAGQGAGPLPGGGVGGGAVVDEDSVDVEQDGADGGGNSEVGHGSSVPGAPAAHGRRTGGSGWIPAGSPVLHRAAGGAGRIRQGIGGPTMPKRWLPHNFNAPPRSSGSQKRRNDADS